MGLSAEQLHESIDAVAAIEPGFAAALARIGYPEPRTGTRGYDTLLRAIVGQQVSIKAAAAIWARVDAVSGGAHDPARLAATSLDDLRAAGLSRMKAEYAHALAQAVTSGSLDLDALPADDEEAIAALSAVRGIGRWSAEIYLLFAEGRTDIWPAGDLAVQIEVGRLLGLDARPTEKQTRLLAEPWRPHRGGAAVFAWHHRHVNPI